jgi:molecular chaperone DnaK
LQHKGYIGIDFGTANSHFAYCEMHDGSINARVIPLDAAENNGSVPSYLLWQRSSKGVWTPMAYGARAIEEWMLADQDDPDSGEGYMLTGAFKPDLATSPMSRDSTREFLSFARRNMEATRTPRGLGEEPGWPVVIGVPAQIGAEHRARTEEAARDAGFTQVSCLEEPLGAVGYHLAHRQIDEEDLERGVLVVDFGGGTLDIATVDRDGIREPWGDPLLGGRLFDDLFFQWVVDTSRTDLADFSKAELLAIWWMNCRRLKEGFSRYWRSKAEQGETDFTGFKGRVETRDGGTFGALRGVGLGAFLERARSYRPSELARSHFKSIDSDLQHLGESKPVDLLEWVKSVLASTPDQATQRGYGTVILTGGSSSWPFMQPMVREVFGDCEILIPNAPESTIGQGLAMYNVLRRRYEAKKQRAVADVDSLKQSLDEVVKKATDRAALDISNEIVGEIMQVARREFYAWRANGGKLGDVEQTVAEHCRNIPARQIAEQRLARLLPEVDRLGTEAVKSWLRRHELTGIYEGMRLGPSVSVRDLTLTVSLHEHLANEAVRKAAGFLTGAIVGGLVLVIAATHVTLAATPLAFLAVPLALGIYGAKGQIKRKLLTHNFRGDSLKWLKRLYSEHKLAEALKDGEIECRVAVLEAVNATMKDARATLDPVVDDARKEALRRFGLLDRLSKILPPAESTE